MRLPGQQFEALDHTLFDVERVRLEFHATGLDLREVQDVVDDRQQRFAADADRVDEVALLLGERRIEQQAGHADHAVHRRAHLMTHVGEELAARLHGRFRQLLRRPQRSSPSPCVPRRRRSAAAARCGRSRSIRRSATSPHSDSRLDVVNLRSPVHVAFSPQLLRDRCIGKQHVASESARSPAGRRSRTSAARGRCTSARARRAPRPAPERRPISWNSDDITASLSSDAPLRLQARTDHDVGDGGERDEHVGVVRGIVGRMRHRSDTDHQPAAHALRRMPPRARATGTSSPAAVITASAPRPLSVEKPVP